MNIASFSEIGHKFLLMNLTKVYYWWISYGEMSVIDGHGLYMDKINDDSENMECEINSQISAKNYQTFAKKSRRYSNMHYFRKLNYDTRAFLIIEFIRCNPWDPHNKVLINFLKKSAHVRNLSLTERGLNVDVTFSSIKEYEHFLSKIKSFDIRCIEEYLITEEIIKERSGA